jgi:hypothetical protein
MDPWGTTMQATKGNFLGGQNYHKMVGYFTKLAK